MGSSAGQASGVEIQSELAQHVVIRDGLIVSSRDCLSHADALEAAGLGGVGERMEPAGLEPATSWVRSRTALGLDCGHLWL